MKRLLVMWSVFFLLLSGTAIADDTIVKIDQDSGAVIYEEVTVEPCYDYLLYVTAGLDIDESGHLTYGGSCCAPYDNVRITVNLERSKNGLFWDNLATSIKTGYDNVGVAQERDLPEEDYFYRAEVIAEVLDSDRNVIESTTVYSTEKRY